MRGTLVLLVFLSCGCLVALATTHVINFSYPSYSPSGLSVLVGDTVLWKGPFDKFPLAATSVPVGATSFGNESATEFRYVVTMAGTYKYQCPTYKADGMNGYFTALAIDKNVQIKEDNAIVYINFISHAFHLTTPVAVPHGTYAISITSVEGKVIYTAELKTDENDKWIATEQFPIGTYNLNVTDGVHSFGRKFSK